MRRNPAPRDSGRSMRRDSSPSARIDTCATSSPISARAPSREDSARGSTPPRAARRAVRDRCHAGCDRRGVRGGRAGWTLPTTARALRRGPPTACPATMMEANRDATGLRPLPLDLMPQPDPPRAMRALRARPLGRVPVVQSCDDGLRRGFPPSCALLRLKLRSFGCRCRDRRATGLSTWLVEKLLTGPGGTCDAAAVGSVREQWISCGQRAIDVAGRIASPRLTGRVRTAVRRSAAPISSRSP